MKLGRENWVFSTYDVILILWISKLIIYFVYAHIHRLSKKTSHLWLAINLTHANRFSFFGRNVTDKVSNQKTLYYATSSNLCFCTTWQNGETRKLPFHSNAVLVHCLNSTSCLISSIFFNSQLILMLLYDSLNLVISAFISELLGAWFRINEVESAAEVGLCYTHNAAVRCLLSNTSAKIVIIGSYVSRLYQVEGGRF